jgi:hypothetical protein
LADFYAAVKCLNGLETKGFQKFSVIVAVNWADWGNADCVRIEKLGIRHQELGIRNAALTEEIADSNNRSRV